MISENKAKHYCKDDISLIENYQQAVEDNENLWEVHHKLELKCPVYKPTSSELIVFDLYYDRPASELIFMKKTDHRALHNKYYKASEKTKKKIAKTMKEKWQDKEYAEHMSEAHKNQEGTWKGKKLSDKHKLKLSDVHKGKKLSEETKRKISEKLKGRGHPCSEETRRKISETLKNK